MTKVQSISDPERFLFTSTDIALCTGHVKIRNAIKESKLIQGKDYVVLERSAQSAELWKEFESLGIIPKRSARITLVYESGFWKLAMNARTSAGEKLRDWLSTDVIPSIRKTGSYSLPTQISSAVLLENTKREVQLENSKAINAKNFTEGGKLACIDYNKQNCLQVTGQTPSELKRAYGRPNKSSKEILREYDPAKAMTMSLNDHLVEKEKMELKNLVVLDDLLTKTFQEMLNIGIKIIP